MFSKIVSKENIKFKDLEKEIFRCMNMFGCLILKDMLEKQDEKIFNERDKEKYKSKGFEETSVHTIMGNVPYKRRRYKVTEECVTKTVYLLDEQLSMCQVNWGDFFITYRKYNNFLLLSNNMYCVIFKIF